ncbi:MAG: 50S ribosomal protein L35 [Candidatus Hydrogenedentota bacterium]
MPKMKTNKAAKKRFRVTKNGKVLRKQAGVRHILTKKSAKRKRNLHKTTLLSEAESDRVRRLLPYG